MYLYIIASIIALLPVFTFMQLCFRLCMFCWTIFNNICLNTLNTFFPESDLLKWGASYMPCVLYAIKYGTVLKIIEQNKNVFPVLEQSNYNKITVKQATA